MDEQTVDQLTEQEFLKNRYVFQVNDPTLESAMLRRIQPGRLMPAPERPHGTRDRLEHDPPAHYTIFVEEQFPIHITLSRAMAAPRPQASPSQWIDRHVQEPPAPADRTTAWILVWQVPSAYAAEGIQDGAPALLQWSPKHHEWMYLGIWLNHFRYWQPISAPSGGPHG
jgi:hypothetical protein